MDRLLLRAVVAELTARLAEQELQRVAFLGNDRYVLRFATAAHDNLLISVRADLPRIHLLPRPERLREPPPSPFAAGLDSVLGGAVLESIEMPGDDRIVDLRFRLRSAGGAIERRRLVVELFGRSANACLLDDQGLILLAARAPGRSSRPLEPGRPYEAPPPPDRPLDPPAAAAGLITSAVGQPVVISSRPLHEFREGDRMESGAILVLLRSEESAAASHGATAPVVTTFQSASEAAQAGLGLLERLRDFQSLRTHHQGLARREILKLTTLESRLRGDLERARNADEFRRRGEALLAFLNRAVVQGDQVTVPDPADPQGSDMTFTIDPALPLHQNAQRLFDRFKKAKRGVVALEARLGAVEIRRRVWHDLESAAAAAESFEDIERLREAMAGAGVVHAARPARTAAPTPRDLPTRVRRHETADGFVVLVGRSGAENDTLTFRVASPWDFWLHAAGHAGAHVVVRNPGRAKTLPERTLRVAAEIAAYYSGAKGEGKVEVHYTQRKDVRKRKGMPPGQVLLRRFRSIQVSPKLPSPAIGEI